MDNKTWLIELEVTACLMGMALVAFALMIAQNLWVNIARKLEIVPVTRDADPATPLEPTFTKTSRLYEP